MRICVIIDSLMCRLAFKFAVSKSVHSVKYFRVRSTNSFLFNFYGYFKFILKSIVFQMQIRLELMHPCEILKDFDFILTKSSQQSFSYFFSMNNNNNKCINDGNTNIKAAWKPFMFASELGGKFYHQMNKNDKNGFSFTLWFQQLISNTG